MDGRLQALTSALLLGVATGVIAVGLDVITVDDAFAQASQSGAGALPPVTVSEPRRPTARRTVTVTRTPQVAPRARARRVARAPAPRVTAPALPAQNAGAFVESPRGPVQGYVANRSLA